jgi:hypothetical protein
MTHPIQAQGGQAARHLPAAGQETQSRIFWRTALLGASVALVLFLALYHLTAFPTTWFDEGSHLHVPKTLVRDGVYADVSSEGYRYYGPTIGVGPTVMLPLAAAFKAFGIGLLQARLVMVLYLLAAIYAFYRLGSRLGGYRLAYVAAAILVTSRGIAMLETGREVLGEVPGLFFVVLFLGVWFSSWDRPSLGRLALSGLLLGLAAITKYQYLLVLAPALILAWLANLVYYRSLSQRIYIVPAVVGAICFLIWQVYLVVYMGPATAGENLTLLRQAAAGAAAVFSPALMRRALGELLSLKVYFGLLLPVLIYGFIVALPRNNDGQRWGVLFFIVSFNCLWYVVASVSWVRYAFLGLAIGSLLVARGFADLTAGFELDLRRVWETVRHGRGLLAQDALRVVALGVLVLMIALPLAQTALQIIRPPFNAPLAMAAYVNQNVPRQALIESWEPEMGFLTDHVYHFPPQALLATAVAYQWLGGPAPAESYHFVEEQNPDYVLIGAFASWVNLYPRDYLAQHYKLVTQIGAYELFVRLPQSAS